MKKKDAKRPEGDSKYAQKIRRRISLARQLGMPIDTPFLILKMEKERRNK